MKKEIKFQKPFTDVVETLRDFLGKLQSTRDKNQQDIHLFELLTYLRNYSESLAEEKDLFEAGEALHQAAYYLEEYYREASTILYKESIDYYLEYMNQKKTQGDLKEAANMSIKIANLYRDKIFSQSEEEHYLWLAVECIEERLEFIDRMDSVLEIIGILQKLAMLYSRVHEFRKAIEYYYKTIHYAKTIKDYGVISNAYLNISQNYHHLNDVVKGQLVILEGMEYFSAEIADLEEKEELLQLSQIYHILKKFYEILRDRKHFNIYSKKEAQTYLSLAKLNLIANVPLSQVASYYRAAALCYQDTKKNLIEAATCFTLSGNYYKDDEKYIEAAMNFLDAAECFEDLENYKQAYKMYIKSAKASIKSKNIESAIESYMHAVSAAEKVQIDATGVIEKLIALLEYFGEIENEAQNHFIAATMFLEAAYYIYQLDPQNMRDLEVYLTKAGTLYHKSAVSPHELSHHSIKIYALCLATMCFFLTQDAERTQSIYAKIKPGNSRAARIYYKVTSLVLSKDEDPIEIDVLEESERNVFSKSVEMKRALRLVNKLIPRDNQ